MSFFLADLYQSVHKSGIDRLELLCGTNHTDGRTDGMCGLNKLKEGAKLPLYAAGKQ